MFVCPNCGYRDDPCWRSAAFKKYAVYCRIDELEVFQPQLAESLKNTHRLEEGPYVYRLSKNNYVYRILKELETFYGAHGPIEKPKLFDPFQKKLSKFQAQNTHHP